MMQTLAVSLAALVTMASRAACNSEIQAAAQEKAGREQGATKATKQTRLGVGQQASVAHQIIDADARVMCIPSLDLSTMRSSIVRMLPILMAWPKRSAPPALMPRASPTGRRSTSA
jgi:hypothetical protein